MSSERSVEIPWAVKHAEAPVLDVGCAESIYLDQLPEPLDGIDVRSCRSRHPHFHWLGDVRTMALDKKYKTVLAISTLEHIGLECHPYGTLADENEGDRTALRACYDLVEPGGKLLVSVPFGGDYHYGWFRQYNMEGLDYLFDGLTYHYEIWGKDLSGEWFQPADYSDLEDAQYDHAGGSARAVALLTVEKPCV